MIQRSMAVRICQALEATTSAAARDYVETARLASVLEFMALEIGGPEADQFLSSAYRYRGMVAYELCRYEAALELFTRALERERSTVNLTHLMGTLAKLDEADKVSAILDSVKSGFLSDVAEGVEGIVH